MVWCSSVLVEVQQVYRGSKDMCGGVVSVCEGVAGVCGGAVGHSVQVLILEQVAFAHKSDLVKFGRGGALTM